jgi:Tol biopolymer transport system component
VIVATRRPNTFDVFDLDAINIETGKRTRLTSAQDEVYGYQPFIPSPDGRRLGFTRRPAAGEEAEIYVRPMRGGPAVQLTRMRRHLREWTWTPDSLEIIFAANPDGYYTLWRVRADGSHEPYQIKLGVTSVQTPFMVPASAPRTSAAGSLLGFEGWERTMNFHQWRIEAAKQGSHMRAVGPPSPLLASSAEDHELDFSPDGQRAVFVSNRTGFQEVWLADGFAGDAIALTSLGRYNRFPFAPRWSNDGTRIAFEVDQGDRTPAFAEHGRETSRILVLSVNGGAPLEVAANNSLNMRPSWSGDDKWIYFGSRRSGTWQLWRTPASAGRDAAVQVTTGGGFEGSETPDGKQFVYKRSPSDEDLWMMPVGPAGPAESGAAKIRSGGVFAGWWAMTSDGIFFADIANTFKGPRPHAPSDPKPIYFMDWRTRIAVEIGAIDHQLEFFLRDFAVSRDGRRLVYAQVIFGTSISGWCAASGSAPKAVERTTSKARGACLIIKSGLFTRVGACRPAAAACSTESSVYPMRIYL